MKKEFSCGYLNFLLKKVFCSKMIFSFQKIFFKKRTVFHMENRVEALQTRAETG